MTTTIAIIRLLSVLLIIALGVLAGGVSGLLGRRRFAPLARCWHAAMVRTLGVRVRHRGAPLATGALLLSNHVSWLDIPVIGGSWPVTFLGKSEIARWPVLGWVIKRGGTLFIARGRGAARASAEISAILRSRRPFVLFPEGTTTAGDSVLRFQPRLLQAAIDADSPVQPVALRYLGADGRRTSRPAFVGDDTLAQSVWRTVTAPKITAEVMLFAPLPRCGQRQTLAGQAESAVRGWLESDDNG